MDEQDRLRELYKYKILDTSPDSELDELAEIASAICDTPISLISLIDDKRQWFKAKKGLEVSETPRKDAFCQHALQQPKEVLVVDDPLNDERFRNNPLVLGDPNIRFYAGAPLETPSGHVLGTLCIIDRKPRTISDAQKKALMLLAKKAMDYMETRRLLIEQNDHLALSATRLKKLSDQAPGAIYQLERDPKGKMRFAFISKGFTVIHPSLKIEELERNAEIAFGVIHPDDLPRVKSSLQRSYETLENWNVEYRIISEEGDTIWHWANAKPEKTEDGKVVWYGTFQDTTGSKQYIQTLEQILFDISHVMRRPIATMLGLTAAIETDTIDEQKLKEYSRYLKDVALEMDSYIKQLNDTYVETKLKATDNYTTYRERNDSPDQ